MFTLLYGLKIHAVCVAYEEVTQVSVQEEPICECFKDPRINNSEGGTDCFILQLLGNASFWVQCFLDLEMNTQNHNGKVPSPTFINYIKESGLWKKSIKAFNTCLSTTDQLVPSRLAEEVPSSTMKMKTENTTHFLTGRHHQQVKLFFGD